MTLPELTFCIWDGDVDERFRFVDMNRIEYNANIIAREAGVTQVQFIEADRSQQFRYDEAQKLENLTAAIGLQLGIALEPARVWGPGGILSYIDFERIESNLFACYSAMGGIGDRITAGRFKPIVSAVLFKDSWRGNPPCIDLDVPMAHDDAELFVFVPHTATLAERVAEMEGRFVASAVSSRVVRITAAGTIPKINIPIKIALGGLPMIENKTLSTNWSGDGPWSQDITLDEEPETVVVGMPEGITSVQSKAYADAGIHVSAVNGNTITITAMMERPTVAIPIGVLYSVSDVV